MLTVVGAIWAQRALRARARERYWRSRFPANDDGIVIGAEAQTLPADGNRAILLVHGYNDTPASVIDEPISETLADREKADSEGCSRPRPLRPSSSRP